MLIYLTDPRPSLTLAHQLMLHGFHILFPVEFFQNHSKVQGASFSEHRDVARIGTQRATPINTLYLNL